MKKSLVIISFAFIFLLSMSIVSAGFFDWLTGDATARTGTQRDGVRTSVAGADSGTTFGATGTFGLAKLRGHHIVESATPGVGCYVKTQRTSLVSGFSRTSTRR